MEIKFTSHAVERSLERLDLTGVELLKHLRLRFKDKPHKLIKDGIHLVRTKVKRQTIVLTMDGNKIITVFKQPINYVNR